MKLLHKSTINQVILELTPTEGRALRAALGEICYGFVIDDFEMVIGSTKDHACQLFNKLDNLDLDREEELSINEEDFSVLKKAHSKVLRELGVEEYSTRTGIAFKDGQTLLEQMGQFG